MKSICSSLVHLIRSKFQFTFPIETFEIYLKEIFLDLTKRASMKTLNLSIFIDFMNIPIVFSEKIFSMITSCNDSQLKESDFVYSLSKIYLGDIETNLQIFASLLDLTNDGFLHKSDVHLLLSLLDYRNIKETKEIVNGFFNGAKSLRKEEFISRSTESNMDVYILFMMYSLAEAPFTEEQVNYFSNNCNNNTTNSNSNSYNNGKGHNKYEMKRSYSNSKSNNYNYNNNGSNNNAIDIGGSSFKSSPSQKLIDFMHKRFDLDIDDMNKDNEGDFNEEDNDDGDLDNVSLVIDDEYSDLAELNTFEDNLSCVLSHIEINVLNPKARKASMNDYLLKKHNTQQFYHYNANLNIFSNTHNNNNKDDTEPDLVVKSTVKVGDTRRKGSFQLDAIGFTPGTIMQSSSNNNNNNNNSGNSCSIGNNSNTHYQSQAKISFKPLTLNLPMIKSSSSLLNFDFTNNIQMIYQDMNNIVKQTRLVLISDCLFIESEIAINSNYTDYLASLKNSITYDTIASFKYAYLISLSTAFTELIDKSTLPGLDSISFYGFKIISMLNGIRKEMKFYTKDKSQLDHFMTQLSKSALDSNSLMMLSNFDIINQIGNGEYSRVYLAKDIKRNQVVVALKELYQDSSSNSNSHSNNGSNTNSSQELKRKWEKDILTLLSYATHPNIIKSYYHFKTQQSLFFVLEYVPNGTLSKFLQTNKGTISLHTKYSIIKQLCLGVAFLHSHRIVHCDLKPDNILVSINPNNASDITIKITDFGFARILTKNQTFYESFGTLAYIAPEILQRLPYSFKVDIWSLGVIMYQILFDQIPFGENDNDLKMIKNMIVKGKFTFPDNKNKSGMSCSSVNKVYYDIISQCLNVDSEKRPKCKEILALIQIDAKVNDDDNNNNNKGYNDSELFNEDEHLDIIGYLNTKH